MEQSLNSPYAIVGILVAIVFLMREFNWIIKSALGNTPTDKMKDTVELTLKAIQDSNKELLKALQGIQTNIEQLNKRADTSDKINEELLKEIRELKGKLK